MDEPAAKKTRSERATQEQLQCYVHFCREHPHLQKGKNNPNSPQLVINLWNELASQLNAQRGPSRTAAKWKETLSLWKYQLRTRARKLKMEQRLTGGGPCAKSLTEFEELALSTFGASAVDGVQEITHLGITNPNTSASVSCSAGDISSNPTAVSLPPSPTLTSLPPSPATISLPPSPAAMSLPPSPAAISLPASPAAISLPPSPAAISLPPSPAAPVSMKQDILQEILNGIARRDERENARDARDRERDERDKQILELLKNINAALNK